MKDICAGFNPRVAKLEDIIELYKQAMGEPVAKAAAAD